MIESFRARIPKALPNVSQALRGGMLAAALLAIVLAPALQKKREEVFVAED
jgi:hypothetical protein